MVARIRSVAIAVFLAGCGPSPGMVPQNEAQFERGSSPDRARVETAEASAPTTTTPGPSAPSEPADEPARTRTPRYRGDPTCQPVCGPPWDRCIAGCPDERMPCVQACENEYRACMRGCF